MKNCLEKLQIGCVKYDLDLGISIPVKLIKVI